ncbi:luciferase-like protein [Xylariales sp. PMI_506]|nr:luciferase-like protein [Xylariales sp. PMI_506]
MATNNSLFKEGQFLLGTFGSNCESGMAITKIGDRWKNTFDNNLQLAKLLDDAGIEFMLPVARWIGFGGDENWHGNVLETITWATGLLAHTKNLNVIATVHTSANHPVVVSKQIATIDQISKSRIGLNIVAGWNEPEYKALGLDLPVTHDERYAHAQEWFDVVKAQWTKKEAFDFDGKWFKLKNTFGLPQPARHVPIVNAAGSGQGREFAVNNVDFLFTPAIDLERSKAEIAAIKAQAKEAAPPRELGVITFSHVVCRPTEQEAKDFIKYYAEDNADWDGVDRVTALQIAHAQSFPHDVLVAIRHRMAVGRGGYMLVGTPEQVADGILKLHQAGFSGTTLSFVDYVKEFPYFRDNVLPLLEIAGIRQPRSTQ